MDGRRGSWTWSLPRRWKPTGSRFLKLALLLFSVLSGALFAVVWRHYEFAVRRWSSLHQPIGSSRRDHQLDRLSSNTYHQWLRDQSLESVPIPHETISYDRSSVTETEATWLANRTRVLCLVLIGSRSRARALNNTWTRHCNRVLFYGKLRSDSLKAIPYVRLTDTEDDDLLSTGFFCQAFVDLINRTAAEDFDWLLVTTDRTYAVVENLRHLVAPLNPRRDRYYLGRPVQHYFLGVYNAADSGIVLSRATVDLLANTAFPNRTSCQPPDSVRRSSLIFGASFDAFIGLHLARHRVHSVDTLDANGGSRFHPFMPEKHLSPQLISVFDPYWTSNMLPVTGGLGCCR